MVRIRLRENGSLTGCACLLEEPTYMGLLALAYAKLSASGGEPERDPMARRRSSSLARFFLEGGDELDDAAMLDKDDIVYVSFDGSDYISPAAISKASPVPGPSPAPVAAPAAAAARMVALGSGRSLKVAAPPAASGPGASRFKFAAFVSHAKAEAAMEARFVQSWLEEQLGQSVFIDSDDLRDLGQLKQHVRDSACIVLIQSKNVLTRPYCLIELLTAIEYGVPIVGLCLCGVGVRAQYNYAEAAHFLSNIDAEFEDDARSTAMLAAEGYDDLVEVAFLLSNSLPNRISISLEPGGSAATINATLERLLTIMADAQPVDVEALPKREAWLRGRSVKAWANWTEALQDHRVFAMCWPRIFDAYIGPNALDAALIEAVMLTVNSVNMCPFCSGLHMECGRMAGLAEPGRLDKARSVDECACFVVSEAHRAAVVYARAFAVADGRGKREAEAFAELTLAYGSGQAQAVRALCWFLYWGSYCGNTLNGALGFKTPKEGASAGFQVQFIGYYFFLYFAVITLVTALLKTLPRMPAWFSSVFGAILASVAGLFFMPLGLLAVVLGVKAPRSASVVSGGEVSRWHGAIRGALAGASREGERTSDEQKLSSRNERSPRGSVQLLIILLAVAAAAMLQTAVEQPRAWRQMSVALGGE